MSTRAVAESLASITRRFRRTRIDIVSESLCDDVLKRLGPSLQQYAGCTIIDCLPGAGVFSKKLHDYLQPRRHILIEPKWNIYSGFLSPLLAAPHSKYRLWEHRKSPDGLQSYIEKGLIPPEPEPDEAFLQVFNATSHDFRVGSGFDKPIDLPISRFASDARRRDDFLARAPFRMLLWCPDDVKFSCLPRNVDGRRKVAVQLEAHAKIEEVAGYNLVPSTFVRQRETSLVLHSHKLTRDRMEKNRLSIIDGRGELLPDQSQDQPGLRRSWHDELKELGEKYKGESLRKYKADDIIPPHVQRMRLLRNFLSMHNASYTANKTLASEQQAIDALDLESKAPNISAGRLQDLLQSIDDRTKTLMEATAKANKNDRAATRALIDDHHALHMQPGPLLSWDGRSYEPMKVSPSEFFPERALALLDFQARPADHLPLTQEQATIWDILTSAIYANNAHPTLEILDTVWPGAYDALVHKVPEFTDIREGGRRQIARVTPRCLTPKMLWSLTREWDKWPFRPDKHDMISIYQGKTKEARADARRRHA